MSDPKNPDSNDYESKQDLYGHYDEEPEEDYIYSWDRDTNRDREWDATDLDNSVVIANEKDEEEGDEN